MLIDITYIVVFFIEMLISYIFFENLGERKHSFTITFIIGTLLFEFGAIIAIFILNTVWINVLSSFIANFLFAVTCFRIKKLKGIFYSILLIALSTFLEMITVFTVSSLNELYVSDYQLKPLMLVIEIVLSKIIYFTIIMLLLRFITEDNQRIKVPVSFYVYPLVSLISEICFWYMSIQTPLEYGNQIILSFVSLTLFLATVLMFFAYQYNAQRENKLLLLQQEYDKTKTDMKYYDILEQQNNNLRTYAHDTKNHLSAIKNLNDNPQIDIYISKMFESLAKYSNVCHSGNKIFDVIINKYVTECNIRDIEFCFDIKNNNLSSIDYYDTVAILGNLLDNAVEAANKTLSKKISIETDYRNNFSVIIISNSCNDNPMFNEVEMPVTTKANKLLHGIGLKSVKKTVKKYNGDIAFDYDHENESIIVTVMLENDLCKQKC